MCTSWELWKIPLCRNTCFPRIFQNAQLSDRSQRKTTRRLSGTDLNTHSQRLTTESPAPSLRSLLSATPSKLPERLRRRDSAPTTDAIASVAGKWAQRLLSRSLDAESCSASCHQDPLRSTCACIGGAPCEQAEYNRGGRWEKGTDQFNFLQQGVGSLWMCLLAECWHIFLRGSRSPSPFQLPNNDLLLGQQSAAPTLLEKNTLNKVATLNQVATLKFLRWPP